MNVYFKTILSCYMLPDIHNNDAAENIEYLGRKIFMD